MNKNRKSFTQNQKLSLITEVGGMCPKCTTMIMTQKSTKIQTKFEIAHIYPLNATTNQIDLLKNEEVLSTDLNDLKNLILLCISCHHLFDNPRTVEDYRELVDIKKKCIRNMESRKKYIGYQIEEEIKVVLNNLHVQELNIQLQRLSYDVFTIEQKSDKTLPILIKRQIKNNVAEYFLFIQDQFSELDKLNNNFFELIAIQVRSMYMQLKNQGCNQEEIYTHLCNWLNEKTGNISYEASQIVISFFVQNCEVFP